MPSYLHDYNFIWKNYANDYPFKLNLKNLRETENYMSVELIKDLFAISLSALLDSIQ